MYNQEKVEKGVKLIIEGMGYNLSDNSLKDTPKRVAKMYRELSTYPDFNPTMFELSDSDQMIVLSNLPFYSLCEHHIIPFFGTVSLGYIPNGKIIGLSKLGRCVDLFSHKLQVQERLTSNIANWLMETLNPLGVGVIVKAQHLCMEMRGIQKQRQETVTSKMLGVFFDNHKTREEFLSLCR